MMSILHTGSFLSRLTHFTPQHGTATLDMISNTKYVVQLSHIQVVYRCDAVYSSLVLYTHKHLE